MRLVPYSEVLAGVVDAMGWGLDADGNPNLHGEDWHAAKRAISKALAIAWDDTFWTDLCRIELRRFHPVYDSGEPVAAGTFRFFPPTGLYYQALQDSTGGQDPATETSPGEWETNLTYWAEAAREVAGDNYDASRVYDQGDVCYDPVTGGFYQVHTVGPAGSDPSDTDVWGQVTALDPRVPWTQAGLLPMGRIRGVYRQNPATYRGAADVPYLETVNGLQIRDPLLNEVWVRYQIRAPKFQGAIYDPNQAYSPTDTEGAGTSSYITVMARQIGIPGRDVLRAQPSHRNREVAYLLYLVTADDGQGGEYEYRASSTDADDGLTVLKPDNVAADQPGRWHLLSNPS